MSDIEARQIIGERGRLQAKEEFSIEATAKDMLTLIYEYKRLPA
jgi:hypothetical protein